jgi:hypothetical protein
MKIALCFSGQFRFVEEQAKLFYTNVIDPNNIVDIFIHGWYDEESIDLPYKFGGNGGWQNQRIKKNAHLSAIDIYKPKKYKIEKNKIFKNSKLDFDHSINTYFRGGLDKEKEPNFRDRQINNMYSMWYSIQQSYLLCQEFALENDIYYDAVIRARFDIVPLTEIKINLYNLDYLHYTTECNQPDNMINDWFNFSNYNIMGAYSSIFNVMNLIFDNLQKNKKAICNEILIRDIMYMNNVQCQGHSWIHHVPRF